jgi:hypothetical protein
MKLIPRLLTLHLFVTDVGFVLYWVATAFGLFPAAWLFKDHENPLLEAWNWSFAPIDLCASAMGFAGVALANGKQDWRPFILTSLVLTFCAGLMALSFWTLRGDFDPAWWVPNVYLALWPLLYVGSLICPVDREGAPTGVG